ncbi:hypothetical protein [Streptomyces syringium]|uniref:hypothetical protein n=1 Tax=Streptomyces syringium TaxID=76729 RepID=UPI00345213B7
MAERARNYMEGRDDMPGVFSFPSAKQATYAGTTHLAIGGRRNVQRAIEAARNAVDIYRGAEADDRSTGDLLAAHLDLARGHMMAGGLDAAEEVLGFVFDSPPDQLSASILARLADLAGELGTRQYRGSPQVARLRERIKSVAQPIALPAIAPSEPTT